MGAVYSVLHIWSHGLGREALAFPFAKKKKGSERLSNLPRFTQLGSSGGKLK